MECLCALSVGFVTGLALGPASPLATPWLLLAGLLGALSLRVRMLPIRLALLTAVGGMLSAGSLPLPDATHTPRGGTARISVEIVRTACGVRGCWAETTLRACRDVDPDSCVAEGTRLGLSSREELPVGARLSVLARLRAVAPFRNPMPAWAWPWRGVGAIAVMAEGVPPRVERAAWLGETLNIGRKKVRDAFNDTLAPPHNGIARALLLGEGNAVDSDLNDAIRASGVSHILAVSGMHVTVLAGALVWLVQMLWLRSPLALWFEARRAACALGVVLAPLVAAFAGGAPSAWRAAIMSTLSYGLFALGRRPQMLAVCAASTLIGMIMDPHDALHPGFVLSVLATSALLTLTNAGAGWLGTLKESARTWLATAPFLMISFGNVQLVSVGANVLLAPVGAALIPLVVVQCFVALWLPMFNGLAAAFFETASGAFVVAAKLASDLDPHWVMPGPTPLQALCLALSAGLWLMQLSLRPRLLGSAALLMIMAGEELRLRYPLDDGQARLTFIDVGQGDSTLIETSDGEHALIDAGGAILVGPDPGARAVLPLLKSLRIDRLAFVMLSHPHPDHYGGIEAVLNQMQVRELWDTGQACAEDGKGEACALLARARQRGTRIVGPRELCGRPRKLGPLTLRVIAPCPVFDEGFGANDNSFVMRVEHGRRSILMTGDAEHEAEAQLVANAALLRADVLKVGHHGSKTSTTAPFLDAVKPWLAVISCGRGNRFGHPHEDVSERLRTGAAHTLRLDQVGGVRLLSDGKRFSVDAYDPVVNLRR